MKPMYRITTSAVILDEQNRVLLGKRSMSEESNQGLWSIPGGGVEADEHTENVLEDNVIKEVREEFGVTIGWLEFLDSHAHIDGAGDRKVTVVFKARLLSGEPQPLEDTDEVRWFTLDEARTLTFPPNVLRVITKAIG